MQANNTGRRQVWLDTVFKTGHGVQSTRFRLCAGVVAGNTINTIEAEINLAQPQSIVTSWIPREKAARQLHSVLQIRQTLFIVILKQD
jgi:hypothetical protein